MGTEERSVVVQIDGGARGNPGPAAAGVVVQSADDGTVLFEGGFFLGRATNNVAEYQALLEALSVAASLRAASVEIRSDSELLVRQMTGEYRVKNEALRELFGRAERLCRTFRRCTFRHVRREDNKGADKLVNQAINLRRNVEDAQGDS
jgi:ribonuclease HI